MPPKKPYTVVIADDHAMMREGLRRLIEAAPGLVVTGETGDGLSLLKMLRKSTPDLVIMDISMPGMRGIEATREIRARHPAVKVLVLSMHAGETFLSEALAAGASGYLLKEDSAGELTAAIERIRSGGTYLSMKLASRHHGDIISMCRGGPAPSNPLTPRERQVLTLIAEGLTDQQIGDRLCISIRTVHRHHANIRGKLALKRTAELVRYAILQGYVSEPI